MHAKATLPITSTVQDGVKPFNIMGYISQLSNSVSRYEGVSQHYSVVQTIRGGGGGGGGEREREPVIGAD